MSAQIGSLGLGAWRGVLLMGSGMMILEFAWVLGLPAGLVAFVI